jgi:hypothetical protein
MITGTCEKCAHKVEHDCINEFVEYDDINGDFVFEVVGHKKFKVKKNGKR